MRAQDGRGRVRPFWLLRSSAQRGTLLSTGLVVVVIAFLASTMTGLALRSPDAAVRSTIEQEPAAMTSLAVQSSLSTDSAAQTAAVRSVIRKEFGGAPLRVSRTAFVPAAEVRGGGTALLLVADAPLREGVRLIAGKWPSGSGDVAVDEAFARAHGLAVGTTFSFAGPDATVPVTVTAVWRPADPSAPRWLDLTSGLDGTDGRVIVSDRVAAAAGDGTAVQWTLTPDADRVQAAQLPRLHTGFTRVVDALSEDSTAAESPFSASGEALQTVGAMQRSVLALQAVIPVPLAVLAVCAVLALALLGRLLADSRRVETRLLRSRGVTLQGLGWAAAVESGVVALVAVVVGSGTAQFALLPLTGPFRADGNGAVDLVLPPLVTLVAAVATATITAVVSAHSLTGSTGAVEAGRARSAVSAGLAVLAVVAAAVTLWRFVVFSSSAGSGAAGVDPTGVLAPAAVLCAIALLGLSAFGPAAAAVERLAGRGRGVAGVLPARQVGRGIALFSGPVALIVLAVGSLSFAAGYAGTFGGFLRDSSLLVTGATVRADLGVSGSPRSASDLSPAVSLGSGTLTASPAIVDTGTVGDTDVAVVVADAARLPALTPVGSYLLDSAALAAKLPDPHGIPGADLPANGATLTLQASVSSGVGDASIGPVTAWVATRAGEAVPLAGRAAGSGSFVFRLPDDGPLRLVAVDVSASAPAGASNVAVRVAGLPASDTSGGSSKPWMLAPNAFSSGFRADSSASALAASLEGDAAARFLPGELPPLRFAVTEALAADDALRIGQRIDVDSPVGDLTGTVAQIVAAAPGTAAERAVLADYSAVTAQLLRTTPSVARASSVWATGADPASTEKAVAAAAGPGAAVSTAGGGFVSRFLTGAVLSTWLGAAGCAVLAVAAVTASIASSLRRRRGEVVVLRAVGLSGNQQAWSRRLEVIGVSVAAGVFGLAGGVAVVLLVGNTLARLSVVTAPATLSVQGRVDPLGLITGLVALAGVLAVAVWAYGGAVRRQAADTAYREETR